MVMIGAAMMLSSQAMLKGALMMLPMKLGTHLRGT